AVRGAAVAGLVVAVVALLAPGDAAVAAAHRRDAGLARRGAHEVLLDRLAVGGAAVARVVVAVVAELARLDHAVAAAGRVAAAGAALAHRAGRRRVAGREHHAARARRRHGVVPARALGARAA